MDTPQISRSGRVLKKSAKVKEMEDFNVNDLDMQSKTHSSRTSYEYVESDEDDWHPSHEASIRVPKISLNLSYEEQNPKKNMPNIFQRTSIKPEPDQMRLFQEPSPNGLKESENIENKLIKVWSLSTKKAIMCSNMQEMMEKGSMKLNILNVPNLKAFLKDGTELDDDEVFQALPPGTVVYLLNEDEKKPWEVSVNGLINSDTTLEASSCEYGSPIEILKGSSNSTSSFPEKGLKYFAPWLANFTIPVSRFSETLKKEAVSGNLSPTSKNELLKVITDEIIKYTSKPSPAQRNLVAIQLIKLFPKLQSKIGEGYELWAKKIYDRVYNKKRKKSIFNRKRKLLETDYNYSCLEYSHKVQKFLPRKPIENMITNLEAKEKMLIEMEKIPGNRCSKIIQEGLKATYQERRNAINSNILLDDLKNMFPAMFTVLGINYDFSILYSKDLQKSMFDSLKACSSSIEEYAKKKKKGESVVSVPITENINNRVTKTILLIPEILAENPEYLYKQFSSETSMQDFSATDVTPHLCLVGDPFSASEVYIFAEEKNLIECSNFIEGFITLIGLYFVANIEFPKQAIATYKFFQSYILGLQCKNLPEKLITFCKALK